MKNRIIYIASFLAAFVVTTAVIIYLNSIYKNIFQFDFTRESEPRKMEITKTSTPSTLEDLKNFINTEFKSSLVDSIKTLQEVPDTVFSEILRDSSLTDSIRNLKTSFGLLKREIAQLKEIRDSAVIRTAVLKTDTVYIKWTKSTAAMLEAMDARRAAKIIQNYSDNIAKDILYTMKKKKAAQILAELNPETANRITRAD